MVVFFYALNSRGLCINTKLISSQFGSLFKNQNYLDPSGKCFIFLKITDHIPCTVDTIYLSYALVTGEGQRDRGRAHGGEGVTSPCTLAIFSIGFHKKKITILVENGV